MALRIMRADGTLLADPEARYFNRELSWLQFNRRVLAEAQGEEHPLLERVRFLAISGQNLDEFFMVRVAGLRGQQRRRIEERSIDGLTPTQVLDRVGSEVDRLAAAQQQCWRALSGELAAAGIAVVAPGDLAASLEPELERVFEALFPLLTPQVLDPAQPFPFVANLGLALLIDLVRTSDGETLRELIVIPPGVPRFVEPAPGQFVAIEALLLHFAPRLFPGFSVGGSGAFRVVRDSDIEIEDKAEDLVRSFRSAILRRRRGRAIHVVAQTAMPAELVALLAEQLGEPTTAMEDGGLIGIADLAQLVEQSDRPELKFPPHTPRFPQRIREHGGDCFAAIAQKDILVHHPYEAFDVVLAFLRQAANDPDVLAIKQTLYRAGKQGAVIRALCDAAEAGKSVTAVIELKARFDEEQNLAWAAQLERAGVQVVYGPVQLKTHAKISLVIRREPEGTRGYCHFGTGNYHPQTARTYTDLSFFTADPVLCADAGAIFNYVTGAVEPHLAKVIVSPAHLRTTLFALVDAEIAAARAGRPSGIWAKMNALSDRAMIDKLYEAGAAGVPIELVVRGICCLRPGVPGLSETIQVKSIIGRFLEHSRIWAFANGAQLPSRSAKVFISSADWMSRNFDRRVELALPIENPTVHDQIVDQVMLANLKDAARSWLLHPDGAYVRASAAGGFDCHRYFMTNPSLSGRGTALGEAGAVPRLTLTPHA